MRTRLIAAAAALMLTVTSLTALANAENTEAAAVPESPAEAAILVDKTDDTQSTTEAAILVDKTDDTQAAAVTEEAAQPAAAEETAQPAFTVANVKTHHAFQTVANTFQVRVGKVSSRTKVCLWSTDCRKAVTKVRRLAADETLTVVAQSKGWYKVVDSTGRTGFVVRSRMARA